jgi:ubiquinone/menaquinone biosynthesis C-methylase UbiE
VSQQEHFARVASRYDQLRPPPSASPLAEAIAREGILAGKRVLDVGCGTGNGMVALAADFGCRVAGVDPSPEMLERARLKLPGAQLSVGTAEDLPFADGAFEGATMVSVVHHLDRGRAFPEIHRVLAAGSRFVTADMHPDAFSDWWAAPFFPSGVGRQRNRFPHPEDAVAELRAAGFASSWWLPLPITRRFSREEGLERLRGRAYSTLDLLTEDEYRAGLERAERELPGVIEYILGWAIVVAER